MIINIQPNNIMNITKLFTVNLQQKYLTYISG
jgi:hypothetical protein